MQEDNQKKSKFGLTGKVRLKCWDKNGNLKFDTGFIENVITKTGIADVTSLVGGLGANTFTYLAVGTDSTSPTSSDTSLGSEITSGGLSRVNVTPTQETDTITNDTLQLQYTWSVTSSFTIEEIGIFNDTYSNGGTMLGRKLTSSKQVSDGDSFQGTYQVIVS